MDNYRLGSDKGKSFFKHRLTQIKTADYHKEHLVIICVVRLRLSVSEKGAQSHGLIVGSG
jgi:hypothetical protein